MTLASVLQPQPVPLADHTPHPSSKLLSLLLVTSQFQDSIPTHGHTLCILKARACIYVRHVHIMCLVVFVVVVFMYMGVLHSCIYYVPHVWLVPQRPEEVISSNGAGVMRHHVGPLEEQ